MDWIPHDPCEGSGNFTNMNYCTYLSSETKEEFEKSMLRMKLQLTMEHEIFLRTLTLTRNLKSRQNEFRYYMMRLEGGGQK